MRRIDPSKKEIIAEYIDRHFCEHDEIPSVRDIVDGTGIPISTVHRYLISMREDGSLDYSGRRTARTKLMEDAAPIHGGIRHVEGLELQHELDNIPGSHVGPDLRHGALRY